MNAERRHAACLLTGPTDPLHHGCACHRAADVDLGYACTCPTRLDLAATLDRAADLLAAVFPNGIVRGGHPCYVPGLLQTAARALLHPGDYYYQTGDRLHLPSEPEVSTRA